jgi:hypothetical protein
MAVSIPIGVFFHHGEAKCLYPSSEMYFYEFFLKKKRGGGDTCLPKLKFVGHQDGVLGNPQNRNWTRKTATKWILHIRLKEFVCSVVVSSGCTVHTLEIFVLEKEARKMCYPFYCLHKLESTPLYRVIEKDGRDLKPL